MAKRKPSKTQPRSRKRARSGSTSLVVSILAAAGAGIWFFLAEAGVVPGIEVGGVAIGGTNTSAPAPGTEPGADPAPSASANAISGTASVIDAEMKPGAMQVTGLPRGSTSRASAVDMPITPALEAA